jgi:hypothetical protein
MDCEPTMASEPVQPGKRTHRGRARREVRECTPDLEHLPKHTLFDVRSPGPSYPSPGETRGCTRGKPHPPGLAECVPRSGPGHRVRDRQRRRGLACRRRLAGGDNPRGCEAARGPSPPALSNDHPHCSVSQRPRRCVSGRQRVPDLAARSLKPDGSSPFPQPRRWEWRRAKGLEPLLWSSACCPRALAADTDRPL